MLYFLTCKVLKCFEQLMTQSDSTSMTMLPFLLFYHRGRLHVICEHVFEVQYITVRKRLDHRSACMHARRQLLMLRELETIGSMDQEETRRGRSRDRGVKGRAPRVPSPTDLHNELVSARLVNSPQNVVCGPASWSLSTSRLSA